MTNRLNNCEQANVERVLNASNEQLNQINRLKELYDFDLIEPSEYRDVTLVLIKNSSAGSIADEIAEKYVSKEDAVSILSHGKINLKDFVRKTELIKFSKLDHLHSQYAFKDHNHNYKNRSKISNPS